MYLLEIFPVDMYGSVYVKIIKAACENSYQYFSSLFGTSNLVAAFGVFFGNKFLINTKQFELASKFYIVATLSIGLLLSIMTFLKTKNEESKDEEKSQKLVTS